MKIERFAFLALASSLASVACSSAAVESDADEGAVVGGAAACQAPGAAVAATSTADIDLCDKMAERAGQQGEVASGVRSTCLGYLTAFKANPAKALRACMTPLTVNYDWGALYDCGFKAVSTTCVDESVKATCAALPASAGHTREGSADPSALKAECGSLLSSLDKKSADAVIACVKNDGYSVWSCVEGLDPSITSICAAPSKDDSTQSKERAMRATCERNFDGHDPTQVAAQAACLRVVANMQPGVGEGFFTRVQIPDVLMLDSDVYAAAAAAMRSTCRQPAEVDAICAEGVRGLVSNGANNAGGRLTNECRSLLAGMNDSGRKQMGALMGALQNGAAFTRKPGSLANLLPLLNPCPKPAPGICVDDSHG